MNGNGLTTEHKLWRSYRLTLLMLTVIFLGLYHGFLFGGQMYAYRDVGADTIDQYLPIMVYETENLRQGVVEGYDLQYGLGKYTGGFLLKYLNPVNLPLLLLGQEHLHIALMLSLYLKYALTAFFALLFFLRLLKNEKAAMLCALLWTFSGHLVLWGQHYHFLTAFLAFTAAMWGFQLFLEEDKRRYLVVPAVALLASTGYYHLYISCFFFLFYGVLFLAFQKKTAAQILKKACGFLLAMLPALCLAGESLLPAISSFFTSSRVEQVSSAVAEDLFYSSNVLYAYVARFLSTDLFGTGDSFLGPVNYYEFPILHVSILTLFAFFYLLQGKAWKRVLSITSVSVLLLCMPMVSRILVFSTTAQRWIYLLSFGQVILIGFALSDLLQTWPSQTCRKRALRALLLTDGFLALIAVVLYRYHIHVGGWLLNGQACINLALVIGMYHAVLLLLFCRKLGGYGLLAAAVVVELIVGNYACVNDREIITVEQWQDSMYHDGTEAVVQWIREQDNSLYRINKTYDSVSECDALIQGYAGLAVYNSTNSAELLNLAHSFGYSEAGNRVRFEGNDLLANMMLGVKYVIAEAGDTLNPEYYDKIYEDGAYCVYQNKYWPGFGYLYRQEASSAEVLSETSLQTAVGLSEAYYLTAQTEAEAEAPANTMDLLPYLQECVNCDAVSDGGLVVTGTGLGMQLIFELPELPEGMLAAGVRITMTAQTSAAVCLLTTSEDTFDENLYDVVYYGSGTGTYVLDSLTDQETARLRLDVSWPPQTVSIESLELILVEQQALQNNLAQLRSNGTVDLARSENGFAGTVRNLTGETAMLCVPLVYSDRWEVTVDGQPAEVCSINGGLVGVNVSSGTHTITLRYSDPLVRAGITVSAASILLAFLWVWITTKKRSLI